MGKSLENGDSNYLQMTLFGQIIIIHKPELLGHKRGWFPLLTGIMGNIYIYIIIWVCLKMSCTPLYPMVLLIIIPFLNGYFIGNINPTFSDKPKWLCLASGGNKLDDHWLVVSTYPSENMKVGWDDYSQYIWKNNKCSKPPIRSSYLSTTSDWKKKHLGITLFAATNRI